MAFNSPKIFRQLFQMITRGIEPTAQNQHHVKLFKPLAAKDNKVLHRLVMGWICTRAGTMGQSSECFKG